MTEYLSGEQILLIHSIVIDETGGSHGVRDHGAVLALEALPRQKVFGKELYPMLPDKAAVYVRNIIFNHPFIDGNKRTAMTAAVVFLENNGYKVFPEEGKIEQFALEIVVKRHDIKTISAWLSKHSRKIKKGR